MSSSILPRRRRESLGLHIALGVAVLVSLLFFSAWGRETPSLAIQFGTDLPRMSALDVRVSARWAAVSAEADLVLDADRRLPSLSLESTLRDGLASLHGGVNDLLGDPTLAVGLDLGGGTASVHIDALASVADDEIQDGPWLALSASPLPDLQGDARVLLAPGGLQLASLGVVAEGRLFDASYRAEWDKSERLSTAYSVGVPSLGLEWTCSTRRTSEGTQTTTAWRALPPEASALPAAGPETPTWIASLREPQSVAVVDKRCPACGIGARADTAENSVDFGEVMVGESRDSSEIVSCSHHVFCWLDEVETFPQAPFSLTSAPLGLTIPMGRERTISFRFAPTSPGRFEGTMTVWYCFATWHEHEDLPLADSIGEVVGYYTSQCVPVEIRLTGTALAKPEARISYTPESPVCGQDVQFDGTGSIDPNPEGGIAGYAWDFGDGATSSEARPVHRFGSAGAHRVQLVVSNTREMRSDAAVADLNVAPNLVEAAAAAGAAAAVGWAAQSMLLAPPLLAVAASGTALAVASIIHELGTSRFPIDQLVIRFPETWDLADVEELMERNIPGSRVIGYFSTLHAFLVQIPLAGEAAADGTLELDAVQERLARVLPSGAKLTRNYVGAFEGVADRKTLCESYDLQDLARDLRVAYDAVRTSEAWRRICEAKIRLSPARVAVIDSGIDADHEEFVLPLRGRSYVAGSANDVEPWFEDAVGHGTQICGIIGAENGTGRMNGILSMGGGRYEMQAYRVTGDMFGVWDSSRIAVSRTEDDLTAWQTAARAAGTRQSVVVNISLGWDLAALPEAERMLARNTFRDLFDAYPDILFVTSAGNGNLPSDLASSVGQELPRGATVHAPGGIGGSNNLTVAATDPSGTALASWSNYGPAVDIAAPGQNIYTTDSDGSYVWRVEGTSYAAALVSGVAAVVRAIDPKLAPEEVKDILLSSPTRVETPDGGMVPVLDFADAVERALESHRERSLNTLWWSIGTGLATLAAGLLILRPF